MERSLFDFGLHCFHVIQGGIHPLIGPYYVLPKSDYKKALIWAKIFQFVEHYFHIPNKTIKISAIIETLRGDMEIQELAFALAGGGPEEISALKEGKKVVFEKTYIEAFCSGRHDRVFDMIKTYHNHPQKIYPEHKFTGIHDVGAKESWAQLAEIAKKRGVVPVGGMVVTLTSDPRTREAALKIVEESLLTEHNRGSLQSWEAMPDTTERAMAILGSPPSEKSYAKDLTPVFKLPPGAKRKAALLAVEKIRGERLRTIPQGTVSYEAVYNNIHQAIEYIEGWLRGHGVIAYRPQSKIDTPIVLQNVATTERARSELWTWLHHRIILSDLGQPFTPPLFLKVLRQVLADIKNGREGGYLAKGKFSAPSHKESHYEEAAQLLQELVIEKNFPNNMKEMLFAKYKQLRKE